MLGCGLHPPGLFRPTVISGAQLVNLLRPRRIRAATTDQRARMRARSDCSGGRVLRNANLIPPRGRAVSTGQRAHGQDRTFCLARTVSKSSPAGVRRCPADGAGCTAAPAQARPRRRASRDIRRHPGSTAGGMRRRGPGQVNVLWPTVRRRISWPCCSRQVVSSNRAAEERAEKATAGTTTACRCAAWLVWRWRRGLAWTSAGIGNGRCRTRRHKISLVPCRVSIHAPAHEPDEPHQPLVAGPH